MSEELEEYQIEQKRLFDEYVSYNVEEVDGQINKYNLTISMNKSIYNIYEADDGFYLDSENYINIKLYNELNCYHQIRIPVHYFKEIFEKKQNTLL